MDNEKYQKELFEFDDKPRKSFSRFDKILPKADFEGKVSINLGLEKVVFISIGIILAMTIVFALGVERGRIITINDIERVNKASVSASKPNDALPIEQQPAVVQAPIVRNAPTTTVASPKTVAISPAKTDSDDISAKPYTIIAMTFKEKETAVQAVNWLKKEGFQAYQKQDGQYFPVCIGNYASKNAAQAALLKIKRLCKDAYLKTRQ